MPTDRAVTFGSHEEMLEMARSFAADPAKARDPLAAQIIADLLELLPQTPQGTEPRPMDPERRAELEHEASLMRVTAERLKEAESEIAQLKAEVEQWRCDALMYAELRDQVVEQRNAVQAKLDEHGVPVDLDADVRKHQERVRGLETFAEETTLRVCENELAETIGQTEHDGWRSLLDAVQSERADVQAEVARLRSRVKEAEVERPECARKIKKLGLMEKENNR
jgi:chromosome segregation ATPase